MNKVVLLKHNFLKNNSCENAVMSTEQGFIIKKKPCSVFPATQFWSAYLNLKFIEMMTNQRNSPQLKHF